MLADRAASARQERVLFFPGEGDSTLLGVLTHPIVSPIGVGALVLAGGGFVGSTHRNDLGVRICRALASSGFHTLRFDWHGVGDSTGYVSRFDLDRPFTVDLLNAVSQMKAMRLERFVIVASCFGARTALAVAGMPEATGLAAMFLVSPPFAAKPSVEPGQRLAEEWSVWQAVRKGLRPSVLVGARDRRRRRTMVGFAKAKGRALWTGRSQESVSRGTNGVSPWLLESLERVIDCGIDLHLVYGDRDDYYIHFREAMAGKLGDLLSRCGVEVEVLGGEVHGFPRVQAQEAVFERLKDWAEQRRVLLLRERGQG